MGVKDKAERLAQVRRRNARERRTGVLASGGCRLDLLLTSQAAAALERIKARTGESGTGAITRLLLREADELG